MVERDDDFRRREKVHEVVGSEAFNAPSFAGIPERVISLTVGEKELVEPTGCCALEGSGEVPN